MDFKALECIVAISEGKSITQAAKNLFISQPALSQYMARVEQELGMPVFIKTGNSIALTSAGEFLAREGKSLLKARDDMLTQLSSLLSERAETLRIGISPFYSKYYLPVLLAYYRTHHPHIHLLITEEASTKLEQLMLDNELDLCFVPESPMREGLTYRPIYMEEIMIALPPAHPANMYAVPAGGISYMNIELLRDEPFVELAPSSKFTKMKQSILRHFSITPDVVYESTSWDTVCMMIACGIGVGFLPKVLMHKHQNEPKFYRISGIDSTRAYSAVYKKNEHLSLPEINLITELQKILEEMS